MSGTRSNGGANGGAATPVKFVPRTSKEREEHEYAVRAAAAVARDFPILPTSELDATPIVGEEPGDNLTPGQRLAVAALVSGETFAAAARAAGVSRRTLYDWRQIPDFRKAVDGRSREALGAAVIRVRNLVLRATRVLGESMLERDRGGMHAFRVLNSGRLWRIATRAEKGIDGGESAADEPQTADDR